VALRLCTPRSAGTLLASVFLWTAPSHPQSALDCEGLAHSRLPNTTITAAQAITGGSFTVPGATSPFSNLPPFCRVTGEIAPTSDSHILFELWLPLENWDGRFTGVGNGGWAGQINYRDMVSELKRGDATVSTNTGHPDQPGLDMAKFAFDHPERLADFAYRSVHETTEKGKALAATFYGKAPAHAYWMGCSSGGYEGLMEAQRFPADYDGIVAGAPANNFTRLMAGDFELTLALDKDTAAMFPRPKLTLMHDAILAACDALDGVVDGVLEDPRRCGFDPASLRCTPAQDATKCLTDSEVDQARRVYAGLRHPTTGAVIYPGLSLGSEPAWIAVLNAAAPFPIAISYYKWLAYADSTWNWKTFDFAHPADFQVFVSSEARFAALMNATSPDLGAFARRGGKLVQYHGWGDQLISPQNSINYYESVLAYRQAGRDRATTLRDVQGFHRLFMAPGMFHCSGGPGPNVFNMQTVVEKWVEQGVAPDSIIARRVPTAAVQRSRPLCPYPKVAAYKGNGDSNDASNFVCRDPEVNGGG
jgi:feruloyl esterase